MFDKRLEINHQIHNLVADAFNTLVEKYDVSTDDRSIDDDGDFVDSYGTAWRYATPFDPRTGEPITELPT